jgi:predicted nucleic acid-binding protein
VLDDPHAAAKAFFTSLGNWRDLCAEWDGMVPRILAGREPRELHPDDFGADNPAKWNAYEATCQAAADKAALILLEMTAIGPTVVRFVNDHGGDSHLIHKWISSQANPQDDEWTKRTWDAVRLAVGHALILAEKSVGKSGQKDNRPRAKKKRRGRPIETDAKSDKRLCADWKAAKGRGMTREAFARARGISPNDLIAAQHREKYRRQRDAE